VCMYLFPLLLKEYQKRYPNIELNVATGTNDEILRLIRANEVDLALLSLPITDPDLEVRPALTEEMVLVMEKDHPLAKRKRIEFRDLEPFTFIHFERGSNTRKVVEQTFSEENVTFRNTMELQNDEISRALVYLGPCISLIPHRAIAATRYARGLELRRIGEKEIYRELVWVFVKSYCLSPTMTK